jgi:HAE1 family hydrophobic/amphiphilic exporter-1
VAAIDSGAAPSKIRHRDLMREIRVSANTQGRSLGEVVNDIKARLADVRAPAPATRSASPASSRT